MGGLLGGPSGGAGAPGGGPGDAGPDELRSIVARAGRRMRVRAAALAGIVALAAGGGVGYAVSTTGGSGRQIVATAPSSGSAAHASSQAAGGASTAGEPSYALPEAAKFTRLFTRQVNGVDIRGYLAASPIMIPLNEAGAADGSGACGTFGPRLQAEVSTPGMVAIAGSSFAVQQPGPNILTLQPTIVGVAEGDPVSVVVVQTSSAVTKVHMDFTGGATDEMAPVQGWAALAAPAGWYQSGKVTPQPVGTLSALDKSGKTLSSAPVVWPTAMIGLYGSGSGSVSSSGSGSATPASGTPPTTYKSTPPTTYKAAVACPAPPPPVSTAPCPAPSSTVPPNANPPYYVCGTSAPSPAGANSGSTTKGSGGS